MQWVIDQLSKRQQQSQEGRKLRNTKKLKYCKSCNKQWELITTGVTAYYNHLPTYGLRRKTCINCSGSKNQTYKNKG